MAIEIRRVRPDELGESVEALTAAFLERPDVDAVVEELSPRWDLDRVWIAHDGERVCGTFRSWATEITVPGGATPAGRRRIRRHRAPDASPTRHPARDGRRRARRHPRARRGHGPAPRRRVPDLRPLRVRPGHARGDLDPRHAVGGRRPTRRPAGSSTSSPGRRASQAIRDVYERYRVGQPGEIRRDGLTAGRATWGCPPASGARPGRASWSSIATTADVVDGYARFSRTDDRWDGNRPTNVVTLDELHALTTDAYATLWRFLAEMDWVATVKAPRRARDERLPWLLADARDAQLTDVTDGLWVRLFDVAAALAARTYEREGRMVIEVVDAERAEGRYRVRLDAGPDGATCVETTETAELDRAGRGARGRVPRRSEPPQRGPRGRRRRASGGGGRSPRRDPADARRALDVDVLLGAAVHATFRPHRRAMMAAWTRCRPRRCSPGIPPRCATIAERLRRIVRRALPDAIEAVRPGWRLIGYDIPSGRQTAFCCFVWAEQEHVHLGFQYGVFMDDPDRVLEGEGVTQRARWLTFEPGDPIDEPPARRPHPRGGADHAAVEVRAIRGPPRPAGPDSIGRVTDQPRRWPPAAGLLGAASFLLIGWSGLLIPSLIRSVKDGFDQSDAGIGVFYFLYAVVYAAGSLGGGLLTERVGRRTVLSLGAVVHGAGLIALGDLALMARLPARSAARGPGRRRPRRRRERPVPGPVQDRARSGAEPAPPVLQPRGPDRAAGRRSARRGRCRVAGDPRRDRRGCHRRRDPVRDRARCRPAVTAPRPPTPPMTRCP